MLFLFFIFFYFFYENPFMHMLVFIYMEIHSSRHLFFGKKKKKLCRGWDHSYVPKKIKKQMSTNAVDSRDTDQSKIGVLLAQIACHEATCHIGPYGNLTFMTKIALILQRFKCSTESKPPSSIPLLFYIEYISLTSHHRHH